MSEEANTRQVVVFTLGAEQYALPIKQVQEIIRYTEPRSVASNDSSVRGVISLRGRIVPVHDLGSRLGTSSEPGEDSKIVIVENGGQIVGVIVDAVEEVLTVAAGDLDAIPGADTSVMDSIAKLGDRLIVLLTPDTIFAGAAAAA